MKFLSFEFIPLMLLPSFLLLYLIITNKSTLERVFKSEILNKLKIEGGLSKKFRITLLFLALFFMIIALARPVYQKGIIEVEQYKNDLVIALDISHSMKAKDYYPNRLTFAKKKIQELIDKSQNLQIGLLAFAKDAYIISPITDDKTSLKYLLSKLETNLLSLKSTNFYSALMSAKFLLKESKEKNLLLVTDGGDRKDFSDLIAFAKDNGFKISVLAVATPKGSPIEEEGGGFLKDKEGNLVITRLNEAIKTLAQESGGVFVQATYTQEDIKELLKHLQSNASKAKVEKIVDQVELYPFFLAFALFFLFASFFSIPGKVAFVTLLVFTPTLKAGLTDFKIIQEATKAYENGVYKLSAQRFQQLCNETPSPQCYYNTANALYKAKEYKKAIEYYNKIQTSNSNLEFKKLHNLGNSYFKLQNYQEAIKHYEKALKIKDDPQTRFNLELAKKMLQKQQSQQQNQGDQKKEEKKKENSQQNQNPSKASNEQQQENKDSNKGKDSSAGKSQHKPQPISDREEKKWLKKVQQNEAKTLLYKAPIKVEKELDDENPW